LVALPSIEHRTYLSRQQFKKLSVFFSDGVEISAERKTADAGPFEMKAVLGPEETKSYHYHPNAEGSIPSTVASEPANEQFSASLPLFNFGFLRRDRSTRSSNDNPKWARMTARGQAIDSPILISINKAFGTARQQTIAASNQGQLSVNAIYTELIEKIAKFPLSTIDAGPEEGRLRLLGRLQEQAKVTQQYSELGPKFRAPS
jgi:hypothetical protein